MLVDQCARHLMVQLVCAGVMVAVFLFTSTAMLSADEDDEVVARVNGHAITLRSLENQLLREEGAEAVMELVEHQLKNANWDRLSDQTTIVGMGNWRLERQALATHLLQRNGGPVRDELIQIALVEQALREEGIVVGQLLLQAELERMERRFQQELAERGKPQMPFEQYIQQHFRISVEEFVQQPGFRMLAGLHALVLRHSEVSEETLRSFYEEHQQHFGHPEQVRLQVILLDFEVSEEEGGRPFIRSEHRERLRITAASLYRQIQSGDTTFERQWQLWGRLRDQEAAAGGDVGWVGRDGRREQTGARRLPQRLMDEAFKVSAEDMPRLLPLVEYTEGMVIARVNDRRDERIHSFSDMRQATRRAYLEHNMEAYSQRMIDQLRRAADIEYGSLGRIVHERVEAVRRIRDPGLSGDDAPDSDTNNDAAPPADVDEGRFPMPQE
ncbi:MAG: peptidyl-prolyl cis-trans isomerase [Planctomycetota bacterium]|nr:MAG: peptidyl-prolyl cis-trans isomerase [Planctomycetota bacterium]